MNVLFLGGFAATQFDWIAPVIASEVETSVVTDPMTRSASVAARSARPTSSSARLGAPECRRRRASSSLQLPVAGTDQVEVAALPRRGHGLQRAMATRWR